MNEPARNRAILASLAQIRQGDTRAFTLRTVRKELPHAEAVFERSLPDFKCNFSIYLMDTLASFDGAGREVGGAPALVLGIDEIAEEGKRLPLRVFLAHELFHRYHDQTASFSDDPGEHQAIWRSLWAEGLATYASYRLTPGATIDQALIAPPNLAEMAAPKIKVIARDLLAHLDRPSHLAYQTYFTYGVASVRERRLPWRSGYYVGFLIAQKLGRVHSLQALAHLKGRALHREIRTALESLTMESKL